MVEKFVSRAEEHSYTLNGVPPQIIWLWSWRTRLRKRRPFDRKRVGYLNSGGGAFERR